MFCKSSNANGDANGNINGDANGDGVCTHGYAWHALFLLIKRRQHLITMKVVDVWPLLQAYGNTYKMLAVTVQQCSP